MAKKSKGYDLDKPLEEQKVFKDKRGKLKKSLVAKLEERNLACEPFLDMVERYMSMWDDFQKYTVDILKYGIRLENGKNNDSQKQKVNTSKNMAILLDKLGISAAEVKTDDGEDL